MERLRAGLLAAAILAAPSNPTLSRSTLDPLLTDGTSCAPGAWPDLQAGVSYHPLRLRWHGRRDR
ncbi:MAG TPA: hypothetical protein VHG52_14470, partial [Thermomicrobiales bacterium]|nr:hypothetical protein [Thermomicrobiales bacterium]